MDAEFEFRGVYYPAFFSIFINGDFNISFEELNSSNLGTLAHEYLHYIQNIDTLMGLTSSQYFFTLYNEALKQSSTNGFPLKNFELPKIIEDNRKRFNHYLGQTYSEKNVEYDSVKIKESDGVVKIELYQNRQINDVITFGNLCVKEGMAHYFQLLFDPNVTHHFLPYRVIDEVCQRIYPKILEDPLKIILLSYLALSATNNSGLCFYNLLLSIKNDQDYYENMKPLELYNNLRDSLRPTVSGVKFENINEAKTFVLNKLQEIMSASLMSDMPYFDKIFSNIRSINSGLIKGFPEIVSDDTMDNYEKLYRLFEVYRAPNIRTTTGKNIFPEGSTELIELVGKKLLLDRILQGKDECDYYGFCISQANDPTGNQCFSFEWEKEDRCPFTLAYDFFEIKKNR